MAQLVTRIEDDLEAAIDQLIADGVAVNRSDAVRQGLRRLIDHHRRAQIGVRIVAGYQAQPQTEDEGAWPEEATRRMIAEETW